MTTENDRRAEDTFAASLELPEADRSAAIGKACQGDAELLAKVRSFVQTMDRADGFMSDRTVDPGAVTVQTIAPVGARPGDRIGHYKLLEQIGEGGFGVVFMAEQEKPVRRRVALKIIKLGMDTREVVARFEAERQALAMMDHPNIAKVLDAGSTDTGRPYFVMELVKGSPITEYCDKRKMSASERVALLAQVCRAVQHAHSKGVIHRDIKPSNVLVTVADDQPIPKVIDFGIAKATQAKLTDHTLFTAFRQMIGTPQYMSPEQADSDGVDVDTRTDVYSLGVLLYELLVGTTPFDGRSLRSAAYEEMRRMIREADIPKPSKRLQTMAVETVNTVADNRSTDLRKLGSSLKGELEWIVMKALEKDRARRYETAAAFADDLGRHLSGEAVLAGPVGGMYRLTKIARRYKVAVITGSIVAALLLLGIAGTGWGLYREASQRKIAEQQRTVAQQKREEADAERAVAQSARTQADLARSDAEAQAVVARRAAARSDARYMIGERLLPAAFSHATDAWNLGQKWEDGFTLDQIRLASRKDWELVASISSPGADNGCFAQLDGRDLLISSGPFGLTAYDVATGRAVGHAARSSPVLKILANPALGSVTVVGANSVERFNLPGLSRIVSANFESPCVTASANEKELLVVDQTGTARIFALNDLSQVDLLPWKPGHGRSNEPSVPTQCDISPSGIHVLLHGGVWTSPFVYWKRGGSAVSAGSTTLLKLRSKRFCFIDDDRVLTWMLGDADTGEQDEQLCVYEMQQDKSPPAFFDEAVDRTVNGEDVKANREIQAWHGAEGSVDFALIGDAGLTTSAIDQKSFRSERYDNLIPADKMAPTYLCAALKSKLLAIVNGDNVLVLRERPEPSRIAEHSTLSDYCARAYSQGLIELSVARPPMHLNFKPFDVAKPASAIELQWAKTSGPTPYLIPWAIAASADGSTIAVVAQESDGADSHATIYGNTHAVIYHCAGGLASAPVSLQIDRSFDLSMAPTKNRESRYAAIDPTGKVLIYMTANGGAKRFSLADGRFLGSIPFSAVAQPSTDGRLAAGIDLNDKRIKVFEVASGDQLLSLPSQMHVPGLCISTDDQRLLVSDGSALRSYSIPDGRLLTTVATPLIPLAAPADLDRFIAFAPDQQGAGGSIVVADAAGTVVSVLNRAGAAFSPSYYSPDGSAVAVLTERWETQIYRRLTPEQVAGVSLVPRAIEPVNTTAVSSSPPATQLVVANKKKEELPLISATDTAALNSNTGGQVTVEGTIEKIVWTSSGKNLNLEFAGPEASRTMCRVSPAALPQFTAEIGADFPDNLKDKKVQVTGFLSRYAGHHKGWEARPEILLTSPAQLKVLVTKP